MTQEPNMCILCGWTPNWPWLQATTNESRKKQKRFLNDALLIISRFIPILLFQKSATIHKYSNEIIFLPIYLEIKPKKRKILN